jgi:secreted trypsin-like serine protease
MTRATRSARLRSAIRSIALAAIVATLATLAAPATAITGGTEDTKNRYSNVGMLVRYSENGRTRCSGTLIAPRVFLTAAHCTYQSIGKVIVTFDPLISRSETEAERDIPRATDDAGVEDGRSDIGYTPAAITSPHYRGEQSWELGTPRTHPAYSDFTDLKNWNDTGVVILDERVDLPLWPIAPRNYLDAFENPKLNKTEFLTIGYGTEVRKPDEPPRNVRPERQPIVRRSTTEIGQWLTDQLLQTQGNEKDPRAGGGTCFGDSGGPIVLDGFVVGDTSYGLTNNCRYIGGYQRVDIPVVRSWIMDCTADLVCPTKQD